MTTRAATFTSKIRNLKDYRYRIIHNLMPQPTGIEIENTLKYFSQTLLSVLKDVPNIPAESYGPHQRDSVRLSVFPNLNYTGLYYAVLNMIDIVPNMQIKQLEIGENVLKVLVCLVPFLEHDLLDSLPYTLASTLAIFPPTLHKDTIELLCSNMLPMTLGFDGCFEPTYASDSAAAIITMVLQHTDNGAFHSQILECFMSIKRDIVKDILSVIAYGPPSARAPAANLLFYYWPQLNPALTDRRGIHYKYTAWPPVLCQWKDCVNSGNCQAVKMCLNPALAIHSGDKSHSADKPDKPPPLYICSDCADILRNYNSEYMTDILLPMSHVSTICENKNCRSRDNIAMCTCFSIECASFNGNRPIRYCLKCHEARHQFLSGCKHVYHLSLPDIWDCSLEVQRYLMDAIVSLLKEAQPIESKRMVEMGEEQRHHFGDDDELFEMEEAGERKLLSRYGIWLLVELCSPRDKKDIPIEVLGRLLGMLFQWFDATAYLPDDNIGSALERLKPDYICGWLEDVAKNHFEVIVSCLLPHPVEYARVGGFWDTLATRTVQIKEGLNCFFCLVPYDIITFEIWDYVMPYWLEAIRTEVPTEDLHELKVLLSKSFDIDMCPIPFTLEKMYHFISERFTDESAYVQEQALQWLQILSSLDIVLPMHMLLSMFQSGVQNLYTSQESSEAKEENHQPMFSASSPIDDCPPPLSPQKTHVVVEAYEIYDRETELILPCYIMMLDLTMKQLELQEFPKYLGIYNETSKQMMLLLTCMLKKNWDGTHTCCDEQQETNCNFCQNIALWHQLTSKVMSYFCPRDPVKIPTKEVPRLEEHKQLSSAPDAKNVADVQTEEVEPTFDVPSMPLHLQLFNTFLMELCKNTDTDAQFSLLTSLKFLVLHAEILNYTVNQFPDFIKYCLGKHLIPNLWKLLQAQHSQLASVSVPLLLHCLTLPSGSDVLWKLVEEDFNHDDWCVRFAAVEKVTVLARLLDTDFIQHNQVIQTALAHAFCLLIGSLEDINGSVAQRAMQYLETIKSASIKCLCQCLEFQFDHVINDRIIILQRMHLLSNVLQNQKILSWEFFMSRFDTLSLEAQLDIEHSTDIPYPTDLSSSDRDCEHFLRKLNRARFALARTDSIRSVSLSSKPPYRRAVSVPIHLLTKTTPPKVEQAKEKACIRQQSAPQFYLTRHLTTKSNLGGFTNVMFPGGNLKEFTDEESNFTALLQKAMDMEGVDRDAVYQLVTMLMKFMVTCAEKEDKGNAKTQNIVLRHLNVLLGYNQTEKSFSVPPHKLRSSAVFNAFISGVQFVLDKNFELGNTILPITLLLLQYAPSPQRYASDYQPPNYTLWYLEPHTRVAWLTTLLVILYKYQFYTSPVSAIIQTLVRIVISTLDAQHHKCKKTHDDGFLPPSPSVPRSKDATVINDLEKIQETETPPQSPRSPQHVEVNFKLLGKDNNVKFIKSDRSDISPIRESSVEDINDTPRRPQRPRRPRKLIEYNEPDEADKGKEDMMKKTRSPERKGAVYIPKLRPTSPTDLQTSPDQKISPPAIMLQPKTRSCTSPGLSTSPAKIETSPTDKASLMSSSDPSPVEQPNVDTIMAKQIEEFSLKCDSPKVAPLVSHIKGIAKLKNSSTDVSMTTSSSVSKASKTGSSSIDESSTRTGFTSMTDHSREGMSEIESAAEDSEKTQTTSDSGGDLTQEETKEDDTKKRTTRSQILKPNFRQRKARKTGLTTVELQKIFPELTEPVQEENNKPYGRRTRKSEFLAKQKKTKNQLSSRYGENVMMDRCAECNAILEQYDEETIGLCIIVLATFIHREPSLATPMLLETILCVSSIASSNPYAWQVESNVMVPGNSVSIARQFLRCCLHQLAPNGIFPILFQSNLEDSQFLKTMAASLVDFNELTCHAPIQFLLEGLNSKKNLPSENIMVLLSNLSTYMNCISLETSAPMWTSILGQFDTLLRKLPAVLPNPCDMTSILKIMTSLLKVSGITNARFILEPFSKLLSFAIQNFSFKLQQVLDICSLCNRVFIKERDKLYLTRTVVFELVQALKFKLSLPDENFLLLVQFVVLDAGGTICSSNIVSDVETLYNTHASMLMSTCAAECMREHLHECIEFIADFHTLTKVKNNMKSTTNSLNEDTLGSQLKAGIAQYIALEITRGNGRDNRAISRYLPWLYHPPSTMQQGPKEFTDCIGHIRLLCWLLIGSLTHTAMTDGNAPINCLPIPLEASSYITDHVLVIITGFDERSKDVLHMSSLFHSFILCQLWTMYCESAAVQHPPNSESYRLASNTIMDFWGRVTPGILQLLASPKDLEEMVNLHFLSLMEALRECNSSVLAKLFPMWTPILFACHSQLPGHLQVRLQTCENWEPPSPCKKKTSFNSDILLTWLKRIQFKQGQVEVQSAAATQFYTV